MGKKILAKEATYVGVDISSKELVVAARMSRKVVWRKKFANTETGRCKLVSELGNFDLRVVVFEPTGGYEKAVAKALCTAQFKCVQVNAKMTHNFAKAGSPNAIKTDPADAAMLAHYGETYEETLRPYVLPSETQQALQAKSMRHVQVQQDMIADKLRLTTAHASIHKNIKKSIRFHEKELAVLKRDLEKIVKEDAELLRKAELLTTCKGIAIHSAAMLLATTPELGSLNRKQIAKLIGLAPLVNNSGNQEKAAHISGGRKQARKVLYMPALCCMRFNPELAAFYQKLIARGKLAKVALTAVMRKLLVTLNAMLKTNSPWQDRSKVNP